MTNHKPRTRFSGTAGAVFLATAIILSSPAEASGIQAVEPVLIVYVTENEPLTKSRPTIGESIATKELMKRGYAVLPSLRGPNLATLCPRNVRGVWNTDRRLSFRQHYGAADILWMAEVDFELNAPVRRGRIAGGTISVVARAFATDTGKSVWYGRVANRPLRSSMLVEAATDALHEILPAMVADFRRDPGTRSWLPSERPQLWPRDIPLITSTAGLTARAPAETSRSSLSGRLPSRSSHTGVVVEANHLRVRPSYRSGLYSQRGRPVYVPNGSRVHWADSMLSARTKAGARPLRLKAYKSEGDRIVLRDSDVKLLRRERQLLERGNVTIVVRPPGR